MLGATEARTPVPPKSADFSSGVPTAMRDWKSGKELITTCMATHETETYVCICLTSTLAFVLIESC